MGRGDGGRVRRRRAKLPDVSGLDRDLVKALRDFCIGTLSNKALNALPQECVEAFIRTWKTCPEVSRRMRDALPDTYDSFLAHCEALGFDFPERVTYDSCGKCTHVFR